ncbi:MAG: hypothetical protein BWY65_00816 [Firmicutes bacterium ADurb.Bin373]|nr:MAG: hypothetical protein BWY65_00816 [Firmicutes bacterium ADurb.Bin373]
MLDIAAPPEYRVEGIRPVLEAAVPEPVAGRADFRARADLHVYLLVLYKFGGKLDHSCLVQTAGAREFPVYIHINVVELNKDIVPVFYFFHLSQFLHFGKRHILGKMPDLIVLIHIENLLVDGAADNDLLRPYFSFRTDCGNQNDIPGRKLVHKYRGALQVTHGCGNMVYFQRQFGQGNGAVHHLLYIDSFNYYGYLNFKAFNRSGFCI